MLPRATLLLLAVLGSLPHAAAQDAARAAGSWQGAIDVPGPGQPTYELQPQKRRGFQLNGLSGYSVRFDLDAAGAVTGARFVQPEGVFPAKRKS